MYLTFKQNNMKKAELKELIRKEDFIFNENGKELFAKIEEKNTDAYGERCISYAEEWGRLMQLEITKGITVAACAELCSQQADYDGISGYMYGMAVKILSDCWLYGESLRKWHNKEYNHQGEGVVNPAIITIGK